ncbi:MAG: GNAT family N-acetyltransferase [Actinomycetota bacterium]
MDRSELRIVEETVEALSTYAAVPIAFRVESRVRVESGPEGASLIEEPVAPYVKDYDAYVSEGPLSWAAQWDLRNWGFLSAVLDDVRIGGAVLAWNTPGVDLLRGRADLAVLWDLRVHPDHRGGGVGHALFQAAVDWAVRRECRELLIETQNVNARACRFYARQGCRLAAVNPCVYADLPDEVQLLWSLDLPVPPT